ncbi:hamartin isoform X3 [Coregonus clupeaformis]|uniref:hamartin isoform X3 n=1 Tax=Coregonus clupeaformis TaxID=59861 RepID=UPI001BDFB405|nr:hamartin isoform X3 [Coregonus clupeaformis]
MAREQPNVADLLPLLESSDIHQLEEIKGLINEHLSTERGAMLLNGLVDYFLETNSAQAINILSSVREPHDKHLLDKMNECMTKQACRLPTLTLLGHVVRKQPSWIHKIARYPLLLSLLKCLKTDLDVVVLITGVLVLITLLPMIPQAGKQHLYEFFDIFGRLASWNLKNPGHVSEVYLIHLHASIYSLFHRLYGMYPCNFVSYLRSHYSMKENVDTFEEVVKPMLEHVRIHPELVTGTKDHELDPTRWKRFEIHDIVIECAKVSLDPKEASCEEGYATMPENLYPHLELHPHESVSSPYTDFHNSYGSSSSTPFSTPHQPLLPPLSLPPLSGAQSFYRSPQTSRRQNSSCELNSSCVVKELWSPSSLCGMATPPSSRGMSPNPELSHSASHLPGHRGLSTSGGKGTPASSTPATSSPPHTLSDEFPIIPLLSNTTSPPQKDGHPVEASKPSLVRQEPIRVPEKGGEVINNNRGSAPLDELHTLRSQLLLLHSQLLYERYKREQHAVRNRRLLRRVINATALEEQNNAMKDQLNLQSVDVVSLKESLQVEQQRCRQLWDDRETVVTRLHSQVRQLQQGRDDYYTKNQELQSQLNECQKKMNELEADLQRANNKVCHTGHLLNQMTIKLSTSESTQQQMSFLNKQLLLLGEARKLDVLQQQHTGSDSTKEAQMVQVSWGKEVERLRQSLLQQGQKLEAAQQRVGELETQLTKKEHLIVEQKRFLEDVKGQAKGELQASESRYQAQRRVTQLLQTELLHLYSRLEMEGHACPTTASAAGGSSTDPGPPIDSSVMEPDGPVTLGTNEWSDDSRPSQSPRGNGSTLSPGQPKANNPPKAPPLNSANSTQDIPPPLLVEPSFYSPHATPLPPDAAPLTVGSYPSANSFLGMRARELFRNKSESQCDEEPPPPRLAGLSQCLKTELCVEPLFTPLGNALTCPVSASVPTLTLVPTLTPVPTITPVPASVLGVPLTVPAKKHPPETRQRATKQESPRRKMGGARGGAVASAARPRQQPPLRIMDYNETQQEHSYRDTELREEKRIEGRMESRKSGRPEQELQAVEP